MIVFDAGVLIALLKHEKGGAEVRKILRESPGECYIHAINLYEIYYSFLRTDGPIYAERAIQLILRIGLIVNEDMDEDLRRDAADFKIGHSMSVCDTFLLALGRRLNAEVLSTDHHELDPLEPLAASLGLAGLRFIR